VKKRQKGKGESDRVRRDEEIGSQVKMIYCLGPLRLGVQDDREKRKKKIPWQGCKLAAGSLDPRQEPAATQHEQGGSLKVGKGHGSALTGRCR
jgi:hypothetical protein